MRYMVLLLQVTKLKRVFVIEKGGKEKDIELPDPNPKMDTNEVVKFYSGTYPELTAGTVTGPTVEGNKAKYKVKTVVGTKG